MQTLHIPTPEDLKTLHEQKAQQIADSGQINDVLEALVTLLGSASFSPQRNTVRVRSLTDDECRAVNMCMRASGWSVCFHKRPWPHMGDTVVIGKL